MDDRTYFTIKNLLVYKRFNNNIYKFCMFLSNNVYTIILCKNKITKNINYA